MERPGDIIYGANGERLRVIKVTRVRFPIIEERTEDGKTTRHEVGTTGYVALQCEPDIAAS